MDLRQEDKEENYNKDNMYHPTLSIGYHKASHRRGIQIRFFLEEETRTIR